jgi:glutamate synthase (NADPH/NADH) large chain
MGRAGGHRFTDGALIGATLDRNGLRPPRWLVTEDEPGHPRFRDRGHRRAAADRDPQEGPGSQSGPHVPGGHRRGPHPRGRGGEARHHRRWPYRQWLNRNVFTFDELPRVPPPPRLAEHELRVTHAAFGWTDEDVKQLVIPMAETATSPPLHG